MASVATWNVNSIKSRAQHVEDWLKETKTDILLLQELKCVEEAFPFEKFEDLGYNCAVFGQKTYNGVAILSKYPLDDIQTGIPNFEDEHSRYIEAVANVNDKTLRVASIYLPNGQSPDSDKFQYKMRFFDGLNNHAKNLLSYDEPVVLGGDYNVGYEDIDVYAPQSLRGSVCFHIDEQKKMAALQHQGWLDTFRLLHPEKQEYSWWDYRQGAWQQNKGLRIDYLMANPQAADGLTNCEIDKKPRGWEKASDHTPVVAHINL